MAASSERRNRAAAAPQFERATTLRCQVVRPTVRRVALHMALRAGGFVLFLGLSGSAAFSAGKTPARVAPTPPTTQSLRVEDVRIEGKLYSPQALFIVSRPEERFRRDVLSHYLNLEASDRVLPYRLRPECLPSQTVPVAAATGAADSSAGRSP